MSRDRCSRTQKLKPKRLRRLVSQRQILEQPPDARRIGFCPLSQLWRNSYFSVSDFQRFRFLKVTEAPAENATACAGRGGDPPLRFATTAGLLVTRIQRRVGSTKLVFSSILALYNNASRQ